MKSWICYILQSHKFPGKNPRTYVGITNDLTKRLRQHDGEISGGAKSTAGKGPWKIAAFVGGFTGKQEALQFEWRMHHPGFRGHGLEYRRKSLEKCLDYFLQKNKKLSVHWNENEKSNL